MAAGYSIGINDVNSKAGSLVVALWDSLEQVRRFKLWLDDTSHNDTFLTGLGFAGGDITTIRNSFADLGGASGLYAVAHGSFAPSGASNYFSNAKLLSGNSYAG